jgi:hypothetical protein
VNRTRSSRPESAGPACVRESDQFAGRHGPGGPSHEHRCQRIRGPER